MYRPSSLQKVLLILFLFISNNRMTYIFCVYTQRGRHIRVTYGPLSFVAKNFLPDYPPSTMFPPYPASWKLFLQASVVGYLSVVICLCHYTNKYIYMRYGRTALKSRGKYIFWGKGANAGGRRVGAQRAVQRGSSRSAQARTRGQIPLVRSEWALEVVQ